jgi:uncharacterized protein YndB with AHSA1/START domain
MKTIDLEASRTISAPAEELYARWLDATRPGGPWFGPAKVILNPVVDGLFHHAVVHDGRSFPHYGRFVRLEAPRLIEHTWISEATRGLESTVTITFEPSGSATTLVTLRHTGVPDDTMGRQHADAWGFVLLMLDEALTKPRGI